MLVVNLAVFWETTQLLLALWRVPFYPHFDMLQDFVFLLLFPNLGPVETEGTQVEVWAPHHA